MKLEILYPELTGLYGDTGNIRYLLRSLPGAERVDTHLGQTPLFATQTPALIVLGPMSERGQAHVLRELQPWRDRLGELIEGGARFLCTGNAFELFGQRIECRPAPGEYTGGTVLEGLALLDFYAVRDLGRRYNGFFLGRYGQIPVTGFNSRFSHAYPGPGVDGLFSVTRGIGCTRAARSRACGKTAFSGPTCSARCCRSTRRSRATGSPRSAASPPSRRRPRPPSPAAWPSFPTRNAIWISAEGGTDMDGQGILRTLPNGVRIVAEPTPWLRSASVGIWVGAGSRDERAGENGSAHFIEHMLFKGTETRSAAQLNRELDATGSQCDAFTAREHTCYYGRALDEQLDRLLTLLCDLFFHPRFDPADIDTERRVIVEEIGMYADAPDDVCAERLIAALYRGSAIARPILGTRRTLDRLDRDALLDFRARTYLGGETVVALCGHYQPRHIERLCACFSALPAGKKRARRAPRAHAQVTVRRRRTGQNHLALAFPAPPLGDADSAALRLLAAVLGGGMSSRLFVTLREKLGLCYAVGAFAEQYSDCGYLCVETALGEASERAALSALRDELRRLCDAPPTAEELDRARAQLRAGLLLGLESTGARMQRLALDLFVYGRPIPLEQRLDDYAAVTPEAVQRLAQRLLRPEACAFSAVGRTMPAAAYAQILQTF